MKVSQDSTERWELGRDTAVGYGFVYESRGDAEGSQLRLNDDGPGWRAHKVQVSRREESGW